MKEEGDWSSERRRRHGRTRFDDRPIIIPEWASLPPELVERIADRVLSTTGGVDAYMDMRAVCPSWRAAIAKPSPLAAFADHRFRPRHWVMLDLKSEDGAAIDDARLFLHTSTGRFRRLRLPGLRGHTVLGASDGLILLREREHPRLARVLNPLTGGMLHFAAPLWEQLGSADELYTAVSGGPRSTLLVWRDWEWRYDTVIYADPTSAEFTEEETGMSLLATMVTFQGKIYYADRDGWVFEFVAPTEQCDRAFVAIVKMPLRGPSYLVESAGELLLVGHRDQDLKVFRVDVERKLLEEVKSIGRCRALFLGDARCVSVDADKLPSVEGDCIYMFISVYTPDYNGPVMHVYNLRDNTMEDISNDPKLRSNIHHPKQSFHENPWSYPSRSDTDKDLHPHSLIQVLLDYCNDAST